MRHLFSSDYEVILFWILHNHLYQYQDMIQCQHLKKISKFTSLCFLESISWLLKHLHVLFQNQSVSPASHLVSSSVGPANQLDSPYVSPANQLDSPDVSSANQLDSPYLSSANQMDSSYVSSHVSLASQLPVSQFLCQSGQPVSQYSQLAHFIQSAGSKGQLVSPVTQRHWEQPNHFKTGHTSDLFLSVQTECWCFHYSAFMPTIHPQR
jgi:hypothetical protein